MRFISLSARLVLAAAALLALAACADATGPSDTPESLVLPAVALAAAPFPPELLIAVADADTRMLPALDADTRAPMHAALTALRAALDAGDVTGGQRAVAIVRALVSGHQSEHASRNAISVSAGHPSQLQGTDGADLAAFALLADAVDAALSVPR